MLAGTQFWVRSFNSWPPPDVSAEVQQIGDHRVHVTWWPDGRLGIDVRGADGASIATGMTQALHVAGTGPIFFLIQWADGTVSVQINGETIPSWTERIDSPVVVHGGAVGDGALAVSQPDANVVCEAKMKRREAYLLSSKAKPDSRLVTMAQDREGLVDALRCAREHAAAVRRGEKHLVRSLRSAIRDLLRGT
jgi:hypothetical protein